MLRQEVQQTAYIVIVTMGCAVSTDGAVNDNELQGLYSAIPNDNNNDHNDNDSNSNNIDDRPTAVTKPPTTNMPMSKSCCRETVMHHSLFLLCQSSPSSSSSPPSSSTANNVSTNRVSGAYENKSSSSIGSNDINEHKISATTTPFHPNPLSTLQTPSPAAVNKGSSQRQSWTDTTTNSILATITLENETDDSNYNDYVVPSPISASFASLSSQNADEEGNDACKNNDDVATIKDASKSSIMMSIMHNELSNDDNATKRHDKNKDVALRLKKKDDEDDDNNDEFLFSPKTTIDISRELLDYSHLSDSFVLEQKRSHQPPRRLFDEDEDFAEEGGVEMEEEDGGEGALQQLSTSSILFMSMSTSLLDVETSFESYSGLDTSFESSGSAQHDDDISNALAHFAE